MDGAPPPFYYFIVAIFSLAPVVCPCRKLRDCRMSRSVSGTRNRRMNKIRKRSMPVCQSDCTSGLELGWRWAMQVPSKWRR